MEKLTLRGDEGKIDIIIKDDGRMFCEQVKMTKMAKTVNPYLFLFILSQVEIIALFLLVFLKVI